MKNTMIKTAIAAAVVAATTGTALADATVYGRLRMVAVCNDIGNKAAVGQKDRDCGLENRSSRFGIKASSEISDGLSAFGRYEFGVNADEGAAVGGDRNRLAYVGLKGGFGEVSLGTRWSPLYNHTMSPVDPTNAFGGTWHSGAGSYGAAGYLTDYRNDDTINYKNKFGAASIGVQVQMDNGDAGSDFIDEYTIGGSIPLGSATIGLGYQDTKDVQSIAAIHARTKFGRVSLGGTYSTLSNDVGADADAIALAVGIGAGAGGTVNLTYGQTDIDNGPTPKEIGVEYTKNMGGGMKWFAGASSLDTDVAGADNTTRYGAGLRYDF